ncbi:MAG: DsrE/DsrF/DrsH-like family protein [Euryarchaeota archaeon]|nr:DsrE/DsrF/DrsH-like family protein [Euryarchaeota archaeon]MDE1837539.1 DsrE/DsrF/DrsH-like family protein [Euryarchaeota archaeon]MDE1880020.1 DsrE/DsrF/DrsH-like family protein [Euryarchaeota archaeon]MDE2046151.1 DsrE/DsrF/DrsH-like family protein [Thermoplasmata archaeon]
MTSATMSAPISHELHAKAEAMSLPAEEPTHVEGLSMVVFSGDLDKVLAAFIIANGAAAMDLPVSMFFTFWGLNVLRRGGHIKVAKKKTTMESMFGAMMPNGPAGLQLSKLKMGGLGTRLIKREMAKKHVDDLAHLIRSAQEQGVRFIACTMSMDLMGIRKEELIDGLTFGNVGSFIDAADRSRMTLFI